jgi:hypothetical protein
LKTASRALKTSSHKEHKGRKETFPQRRRRRREFRTGFTGLSGFGERGRKGIEREEVETRFQTDCPIHHFPIGLTFKMNQTFPPNHSAPTSQGPKPQVDIPVPKNRIVYKFLDNIGGRLALHERTIKYTSIAKLNDPFECMHGCFSQADIERLLAEIDVARPNPSEWKKFCDTHSFITKDPAFRDRMRWASKEEWIQELERGSKNVAEELRKHFGKMVRVASFSEQKNSILMWSHYAAQHKGIVIGYDIDCFSSIRPVPAFLLPVKYPSKRLEMPLFLDNTRDMLARLATTKFLDWSYEHEWRSILMDSDHNTEEGIPVFPKIDSRFIREIYLGTRVNSELTRACCMYCVDHPECELYQACFHPTDYALNFERIRDVEKIQRCSQCWGGRETGCFANSGSDGETQILE